MTTSTPEQAHSCALEGQGLLAKGVFIPSSLTARAPSLPLSTFLRLMHCRSVIHLSLCLMVVVGAVVLVFVSSPLCLYNISFLSFSLEKLISNSELLYAWHFLTS